MIFITGGQRDNPGDNPPSQSAPKPSLQAESIFGDSSGPLFSMYSKAAEEEDNKMVERWQKDADGILIFVSPCVSNPCCFVINWNDIDRPILCCRRRTPRCDRPGLEAKQPGYLRVLSWEHISGSRRPERNAFFHPCGQTALVLSSEICCLGELSLVLEPGHEPQLCSVGDIFASMGASIYPSDSACTVQPREASAKTCILCQRGGQDACSVGS